MSIERDQLNVLLDPNFLDGIDGAGLDELTRKRDACRHAQAGLSYLRRLLSAELEIVEAEVEWRVICPDRERSRLAEELPDAAQRVVAMPDDELAALAEHLRTTEARVSSRRRALHHVIDRLESRLAVREALVDAGLAALLERGGAGAGA